MKIWKWWIVYDIDTNRYGLWNTRIPRWFSKQWHGLHWNIALASWHALRALAACKRFSPGAAIGDDAAILVDKLREFLDANIKTTRRSFNGRNHDPQS